MPFHLFRYLDEQAWRFNERKRPDDKPKTDGERFLLMLAKLAGKRLTYKHLTGKDQPTLTSGPRGGGTLGTSCPA